MIGPRLKDLGRWYSGGTPPSERQDLWDGKVPWLSGKDFDRTRLREPIKFTTAEGASKFSRLMPAQRSVLVLVRGMALAHGLPVAHLSFDAAINQDVRGLEVAKCFDARFIHHALVGRRAELDVHIDRAAHGTARARDTLYTHRLTWMPTLREQQTIAHVLDREGERIRTSHVAATRMHAAALAAFGDWSAATFLLSQGATDRLKYLVESPVGGTWGSEPGTDAADVLCARVADFDREALTVVEPPTVRSVPQRDALRLALREGDLLLEKSGGGAKSPVGFVVRYCHALASTVISSNFVARLRPRPGNEPLYLSHLFAALYRTRRNEAFVKQNTGIQNLDVEAYLSSHVPVRTLEAQRALAREAQSRLEATLELRASAEKLRAALDEYRDALIREAVTGRLDLTRASDREMEERVHAAAEGRLDEVAV